MIKSIWDLFNSKYNDASRYTEEETKLAEEVLSDVQTLLELDADKNDYCWHDLRKNPDDVPDEPYEAVLVAIDIGCGEVDYDIFCYGIENWSARMVIAWKHIEPFEEEDR